MTLLFKFSKLRF